MPGTVRYGLISTAAIGFRVHLPAANASPGSELVAVSSRNLATARAAASKHGIPLAFGSYQELIDSDEVDAVIITLPNGMHHEWTVKAAGAGKHVLCEKPLCATMAEAREMKAAAEANGVVLIEAFTPRWNRQMHTVRRLIADGEIGRVIRLEAATSYTQTDPDSVRLKRSLAGGSLMDAGCYGVYALRYAMGAEPVRAMAIQREQSGIDMTINGLLAFENGAVGHVWSSLEGPRRVMLEVFGTGGVVTLDDAFSETGPVKVVRGQEAPEVMEMTSPNRYQVQLDEFSECVLTGKAPQFPPDDALRNMASIVALYESAEKGRAVAVERV